MAMLELSLEYFDRVLPLLQASGMKGHLSLVYSVLEGRQAGPVLVDRVDQPKIYRIACCYNGCKNTRSCCAFFRKGGKS